MAFPAVPPADLLPSSEKCMLLVIDMQERLASVMPTDVLPGVVRNARILIETAKEFDMPVAISEHYPKGLGFTVTDLKTALPDGVQPVEKVAFSCCRAPAFRPALDPVSGPYAGYSVILCGMETQICVLQTALDLLAAGRRVYVAADAVCSRTKLNWQVGLDLMRQAGAVIGSTEMFAFALFGAAGTERFKRIQKLIK